MKIDYVFTYVNGNDENFKSEIKQYKNLAHTLKAADSSSSRFRDWETLPYLLRGISQNMPWINNVYMIVKSTSQVPEFINQETVNIIYHDQIIPYKFLPTFNSNTIELFLCNIPGLSEYFLYSNDDIYPINPSTPESWYTPDGIPKVKVSIKSQKPYSVYTKMLKSTEILCKKELKMMIKRNEIMRGDHSTFPMRKSMWQLFWKNHKYELENSITMFRKECNITPELSNFYWYLTNYVQHSRINQYYAFVYNPISKLKQMINNKDTQNVCINDLGVKVFENSKRDVQKILKEKFPEKSKYEN